MAWDTILKQIVAAGVRHEQRTGKPAKNAYIGRKQLEDLVSFAQAGNYLPTPYNGSFEGGDRPEVNGLYVYVVNAESHLNVG